jgi:predicted dehydrogenase
MEKHCFTGSGSLPDTASKMKINLRRKAAMNKLHKFSLAGFILLGLLTPQAPARADAPIRVVIVGLNHGHVQGLLKSDYKQTLDIVGIYERDPAVAKRYQERYNLDPKLFSTDLPALLDERKPQAAWVFTSTFAHLEAVEACAPRGIHVIVEKPLAIDKASADRMAALAWQYGIHLLTNLETTWYTSLHEAYRLAIEEKQLGEITKIVSHFGHAGPVEIGVGPEFLSWLTDPRLNGGGASADFGCYGEDIITWMMGNQRPLSVTAVFQTNKPETYRNIDDNATIILEYPRAQGIIQASWDWTFPRKDVHIYGRSGIIRTIDPTRYDIRLNRRENPVEKTAADIPKPSRNTIEFFTAVIRGEIDPAKSLSSLETNLIAMEIMDAARESARTGRKIVLPKAASTQVD